MPHCGVSAPYHIVKFYPHTTLSIFSPIPHCQVSVPYLIVNPIPHCQVSAPYHIAKFQPHTTLSSFSPIPHDQVSAPYYIVKFQPHTTLSSFNPMPHCQFYYNQLLTHFSFFCSLFLQARCAYVTKLLLSSLLCTTHSWWR